MADYSATISLSDHKKGDKWIGITSIGPVTINGSQPANALTRIRMSFKKGCDFFFLDSDNSEITISNATTWEANIPEIQNFLPLAGDWGWDMEFYQTGETSPLTLYKGVITVYDDIS